MVWKQHVRNEGQASILVLSGLKPIQVFDTIKALVSPMFEFLLRYFKLSATRYKQLNPYHKKLSSHKMEGLRLTKETFYLQQNMVN
jgi:hypothetical protein